MDSSESEKLRNQFITDWRTQITDLSIKSIGHMYLNDELTDVLFIFRRNDSITVFTFSNFVQDFIMPLAKNGVNFFVTIIAELFGP